MITNDGKNIIAKYLIGQASAYASHIAIGCGPTPLGSSANPADNAVEYAAKKRLDFEMLRVPVTSRGYVSENGVSKIVFTAELPTEERYEITEVGVFSAGANTTAGAYDSKILYTFSENWEYSGDLSTIPYIPEPLDGNDGDNIISTTSKVFRTNADNKVFSTNPRVLRNERCRYLNSFIALRGDSSEISTAASKWVPSNTSNYIKLSNTSLNLDNYAQSDLIKVAYSVINKNGEDIEDHPTSVKIIVEFLCTTGINAGKSAQVQISDSASFSGSRYRVFTGSIDTAIRSSGWSWSMADTVRVYTSVLKNTSTSANHYVCLDGIRIENTSTANPIYGMTGYSVIKNTGSLPIIKSPNTTNYIEFRFGLGIQ